ncbi:MAG: flagellin, partial [Succinivibrio sp.]|nr:flagellin [Succinivibrio sp.]
LSGMAALAEAKNVQVAYESGTKGTFKPSAAKGSGLIADKNGYHFDVTTFSSAERTIVCVDALLNMVDTKRAELGAIENRMESTIRNQQNTSANVSDARSRIRDTDYADEAANMTSQSIIQQAASSILTQANQKPQIALSLLQG